MCLEVSWHEGDLSSCHETVEIMVLCQNKNMSAWNLHFQTSFAVRTRTTMCNGLNMANTRKSWLRAPTSEARFVISVFRENLHLG